MREEKGEENMHKKAKNSSEKLIFNIASITIFGAGDGTTFMNIRKVNQLEWNGFFFFSF